MINLLRWKNEKIKYERNTDKQTEGEVKQLKNSKLSRKDFIALIMAAFQIIMPFAIAIVLIYFFIILFITKFWMN